MDITTYVVSGRDQALLYGDYGTYRTQLSNRLLSIRKKLGQATKKNAKYSKHTTPTAEDIAANVENVYLELSTAERAWAHAMYMKSAHSADTKGITGTTKSHIISRLHKASRIIAQLLEVLKDRDASKANEMDVLELQAYAGSLKGAEEFEKQKWETCIQNYSTSWIIYTAIGKATRSEAFKDFIASTIEPSIRYAAYQLRMPRTIAIPVLARKYFPKDTGLSASVEKLNSSAFEDPASRAKSDNIDSEAASRTIKWRSRTVDLENATIAVALASVNNAKKELAETLTQLSNGSPQERAAAYDDILIASQDAVDATKHAIDELITEGIGQSDKRMQALQITRTAVTYDMISWRIGRNRVLTGSADGSTDEGTTPNVHTQKKIKIEGATEGKSPRTRSATPKEKVVMYDSTLQSLESVRELPGVAADTSFLTELQAKSNYFRALKCLVIARSYSTLSDQKSALALLARASELMQTASPASSSSSDPSSTSPPSLVVSSAEAQALVKLLRGELQRSRALVELSTLNSKSQNKSMEGGKRPLVEFLNEYPSDDFDLTNLVTYPPKIEPIPVKPLFFDVAWNYIKYPGQAKNDAVAVGKTQIQKETEQNQAGQQKKGWFGFSR